MTSTIYAEILANASVDREVLPDDTVVWVARDLTLDGCIAQGPSREEALAALGAARVEYQAVVRELKASTPGYVTVVGANGEMKYPINSVRTSVLA